MRIFYLLLISLFSTFAATAQTSNYSLVKGYVTNTNGAAINNWPVYISVDSTSTTGYCPEIHTKYTNANGYYIDTIFCTSPFTRARVATPGCNGALAVKFPTISANRVAESNFVVCGSTTTSCTAYFTAAINGGTATFNSSQSVVSSGSTITERFWSFGDNTTVGGNSVQVNHTYASSGTYTVRLIIVSSNQCRDTIIKSITVNVPPQTCNATFFDSVFGAKVYFISQGSTTSPGDSIVERLWNFGEWNNPNNNSLGGNVVNPSHQYLSNGTYTTCLTIRTTKGCYDSICKPIVINSVPQTCFANFSYNRSGFVTNFNSQSSYAAANDTIKIRKWQFGDGDSTMGNAISLNHTYKNPGYYNACLTITTASGCSKKYCEQIYIPIDSCRAEFTSSPNATNRKLITFFSNNSSGSNGTSIISRKWYFGDGDSLSGNTISPQHLYAANGSYNVCLKITTGSGCTSTLCKIVTVSALNCVSRFTYTAGPAVPPSGYQINFNSMTSETSVGDSIVERIWLFGDGTTLGGNRKDPAHTYTTTGTYTVCLVIRSLGGCSDTSCMTIQVPLQNQVYCQANFGFAQSATDAHLFKFNSSTSTSSPGSTIISRTWYFGDGDSLTGNVIDPQHLYNRDTFFVVCLKIKTSAGCVSTECKTITVAGPRCKAKYTFTPGVATPNGYPVNFDSYSSEVAPGDSIIKRTWMFGDGSSLSGNVPNPVHWFTNANTYYVCLAILSSSGCSDTLCLQIKVPLPGQGFCNPAFTYTANSTSIKFQSSGSMVAPGDSIISRTWTFGDSSSLNGNIVDPYHVYYTPGLYNVCLKITTAKGCQSTICKVITVPSVNGTCGVLFNYKAIAPRKIQFNTTSSWTAINDSIVERKWRFGDGTTLTGNNPNPVHEYVNPGIYTTCLRIMTSKGCVSETCNTVTVKDSSMTLPDSSDIIKIVSLYPNPAGASMNTVVWSKVSNVTAELAVFDIYGVKKWSMRKILLQGYNVTNIPTNILLPGPYTFRVNTIYGIRSSRFYKL